MKLSLRRKFKGSKYTIGDLSIDGTFFCNTIEDVIRELPDSCPNTSRWYIIKLQTARESCKKFCRAVFVRGKIISDLLRKHRRSEDILRCYRKDF